LRQLIQHLGLGRTELIEVPAPGPRRGRLLVRARRSLVSLGTERMLVEFGRGGWLSKARQQPEKFRAVLAKVRSEGLFPTLAAVRRKLAQPLPLGYCHVGEVLEAGEVPGFAVGDLVVSNSPHAEVVSADPAFAARVPAGVSADHAAFAPLAAVALQGLRLISPQQGETVVVMGLGLIGQLAVRLLRARGVQVVGVDPDATKLADAKLAGALVPSPGISVASLAPGGAAGVLITASTSSDEPVNLAARLCRRRGRVVIAGMKVMFSKESHRAMLQEIQRPGPLGERLGKGVAGLLLMLFKESNGTMPPAVMIPAGVKLLMEAVDFLRKSGLEKPTNADIGDGIQIMMSTVLEKFGVAPDKLEQLLNQYSNENIPEMGA